MIAAVYIIALVVLGIQSSLFYATLGVGNNYERSVALHRGQFFDFRMCLECGKLAGSEHRFKIYDPQVQADWYEKTMRPMDKKGELGYISYAPYFNIFLMYLAKLPEAMAVSSWVYVTFALAVFCTLGLLRQNPNLTSFTQKAIFLLGAFVNMPSWYGLSIAQLHWFEFTFIGAYFMCLLKSRDILAGLSLVMVAVKPQYAVWLAIPAIVGRRWKIILCAAISAGILCAISAVQIGWQNIWEYPMLAARAASDQHIDSYAHMSRTFVCVRAIFSVLLPWSISLMLGSAIFISSLAFAGWIWMQAAKGSLLVKRWAIALTMVLCLLTSAHSHIYDCVLLVIPAALTLPTLNLQRIATLEPLSLRLWSFIMIALPLLSLTYSMWYQYVWPCDFAVFILIEALLVGFGFDCFRRALRGQGLGPTSQIAV